MVNTTTARFLGQKITGGGASTILLSNTVWVNFDISESVPASRIFKTYAEAVTWIQTNGTPATTPRKIELPGGDVGDICIYSNIFVSGDNGTTIDNLTSDVTIGVDPTVLLTASVELVTINNLALTNGKGIFISNSKIFGATAVPDSGTGILAMADNFVFGGDFEGYYMPLATMNCQYYNLAGITNISGDFQNSRISSSVYGSCTFSYCVVDIDEVKDGVEINAYDTIFTDDVSVSKGGTLTVLRGIISQNLYTAEDEGDGEQGTVYLKGGCYIGGTVTGRDPIISGDYYLLDDTAYSHGFVSSDISGIIKEITDKIIKNGTGTKYLSDDGTYKFVSTTHNSLSGLQGGTSAEYYHLTSDEYTKLDGIQEGAEVNVQSDRDQTDTGEDDYIKNKPTIPTISYTLLSSNAIKFDGQYQYGTIGSARTGDITVSFTDCELGLVGVMYHDDSAIPDEITDNSKFKIIQGYYTPDVVNRITFELVDTTSGSEVVLVTIIPTE